MKGLLMFLGMTTVIGCMPASNIPDPYPIKTTTYELDRDIQKWTQQDCTTVAKKKDMPNDLQTICYKKSIPALPSGIAPLAD